MAVKTRPQGISASEFDEMIISILEEQDKLATDKHPRFKDISLRLEQSCISFLPIELLEAINRLLDEGKIVANIEFGISTDTSTCFFKLPQ